jgi:hypothetical protein
VVEFVETDELEGARFHLVSLRGARLTECDLSGARIRGVEADGLEIDLREPSEGRLVVNGVDVVPLVEAELDRRFPGRGLRTATTAAGLRLAWSAAEGAWTRMLDRAAATPDGFDAAPAGEWSLTETLRHLVMSTDAWLRFAVLGIDQPFHPYGVVNVGFEEDGGDMSVFSEPPSLAAVLDVRAERVGMVRDFLAEATDETLAAPSRHAWAPQYSMPTLGCLRVILNEEWEHLRIATRDLDQVSQSSTDSA